jgi:hypothetical protein
LPGAWVFVVCSVSECCLSFASEEDQMTVIAKPVRICRICTHSECVPPYRRFFFTEEEAGRWECPDHGRAPVRVQVNRPYERPAV